MAGRPSILNEELICKFEEKLKKGLFVQTVCDILMVHQTSYNNWLKQGEKDFLEGKETIFSDFYFRCKAAKGMWQEEARDRIVNGEQGWQGTCWWLERTNSDYMPKQQINAGSDGKVSVYLGGKVKGIKEGTLQPNGEIKPND